MTTRSGSDDDLDEVAMSFVDELMAEAAQLSAEEAAQHPSAEAYALAARGRERIARMAMGDAAPAFASGSADDLATAAHDGSQAAIPIAWLMQQARAERDEHAHDPGQEKSAHAAPEIVGPTHAEAADEADPCGKVASPISEQR